MNSLSQKSKWSKLPNYLTILRMVITPFVVATLFIDSPILYKFEFWQLTNEFSITYIISGILFIVACISDFLDGYLARKYQWISDFGKIWDPIADKVLTTSIYICFAILNLVPFYFVILMVIRDTVVDAYRQSATKKGIVTPANIFGKLKTVFQMISIILIYFCFSDKSQVAYLSNNLAFYLVQNGFVILATIMSLASGYIYVNQINNVLKKEVGDKND